MSAALQALTTALHGARVDEDPDHVEELCPERDDSPCGETARMQLEHLRFARWDVTTAYVDEGWWHPNVKSGQVHDHKPVQPQTMHRLCVPVYTRRKPDA